MGRSPRRVGEGDGDFHLSIGKLERQGSGSLLWELNGTIDGRGVAYTGRPNGGRVRRFDPTSPEVSGVPSGVRGLGTCLRKAGGDPDRIKACTEGLGGG